MSDLYILAGQSNAGGHSFGTLDQNIAALASDTKLVEFFLGGTTLFGRSSPGIPDWSPYDDDNPETGELYRTMIDGINAEIPQNTPKGVIWIQGESDANSNFHEHYEANFTQFVENLIGLYGASFKIVVVQLSSMAPAADIKLDKWENVREAQARVADTYSNVTLVSTTDIALENGYDTGPGAPSAFVDIFHYAFDFHALISQAVAEAVTGETEAIATRHFLVSPSDPAFETDLQVVGNDDNNNIRTGNGDDTIKSGEGNDRAISGAGNDIVFTEIGDDVVISGSGDDVINGGSGDDKIYAGTGNDLVYGDLGNDIIYAGTGDDVVFSGYGDDIVFVEQGTDTLNGGLGIDTLEFSRLTDTGVNLNFATGAITGSAFARQDTILSFENASGSKFDDTLRGSTTANALSGGLGDDRIFGRGGDDIVTGGGGADYMDGGTDRDILDYSDANGSGITINLDAETVSGDPIAVGDIFVNFEDVAGTAFADTITGSGDSNRLWGGAGADIIDGGAGDDFVFGGAGADDLTGGTGRDRLVYLNAVDAGITIDLQAETVSGSVLAAGDTFTGFEDVEATDFADILTGSNGNNRLYGQAGDDTISAGGGRDFVYGGTGADTLDGGSGRDALVYGYATDSGVMVNLALNTVTGSALATGDIISNFEDVVATEFADTLIGSAGANRLWGRVGNDIIEGAEGKDFLYGEAGDDTLTGGAGADRLDGGSGRDTLVYSDATDTGITIDLSLGTVSGSAIATGDTFVNFEDVTGTDFADTIIGSNSANRLRGGAGDDDIQAGAGNDLVYGGAGGDTLDGGLGRDAVVYSDAAGSGIIIDLELGTVSGDAITTGDTFTNFEDIIATDFADTITGSDAANRLFGNAGSDVIDARGGNDFVYGGEGADDLDGGSGRDSLVYVKASDIGIMIDMGLETISGSVLASGDTFVNFEDLIATNLADEITGSDGANRIQARYGNDIVYAEGGNDFVYGGFGIDFVAGGIGADYLDGGSGRDTIVYDDATDTGIMIDLAASTVTGSVFAANDTFVGFENVRGTNFADQITGNTDFNTLEGEGGDDTIFGGIGNDALYGGAGSDNLWGEAGRDRFNFVGDRPLNASDSDIIHDYTAGEDRIIFFEFTVPFEYADLTFADTGTGVKITADELGNHEIIVANFDFANVGLIEIVFEYT